MFFWNSLAFLMIHQEIARLINKYSKGAGYKINIQKSLAFLCTNNDKTEREIKETIPFIIAMKVIKYLGINLPKETKDLYIENYKTLMKEIRYDTNRWRNIPCPWIRPWYQKYTMSMDQYSENEYTQSNL